MNEMSKALYTFFSFYYKTFEGAETMKLQIKEGQAIQRPQIIHLQHNHQIYKHSFKYKYKYSDQWCQGMQTSRYLIQCTQRLFVFFFLGVPVSLRRHFNLTMLCPIHLLFITNKIQLWKVWRHQRGHNLRNSLH